ncbi:hypothetical protein K2173_020110 [Erythroxylum novogranatense]|uniref:Retrotransposon gag domain-containing protein n=1 Tax=Erythroxylum novogranatense TaxID=1862640 RepID=A0AAV8U719_9ROSI|nr:hypothetical protein K2173_020110 [Erythroxylum novogranatense]
MSRCVVNAILYDPEIEKTAKRLRNGLQASVESDTETEYEEEIEVEQQPDGKLNRGHAQDMALNKTLQDLGRPTEAQHLLCIDFPELQEGFELKSGLIHLLPTFRGLENEDPNKHLKEFHLVCTSMKPRNVTEDQIKLRAFPFSLQDAAKDWLYYLPPGTINTWEGMSRQFLEKYFPASRAANIRREICGIKQKDSENLYEYWERYKRILASCPQHDISEQLIIQYFYDGLIPMERRMMDAASGGAIVSKTPVEARELISTMAANSQQFGARPDIPRRVNEVNVTSLNEVKSLLTTLVEKLNVGTPPPARACGICTSLAHPTDAYPTLHDETPENVNSIRFQQRKFDPYSNTYNPGWRSHPNFSYANNQPTQQNFYHGPPPPP